MLELPRYGSTDPIYLADWLEMYAVSAGDGNSSRGDIEGALRVAALSDVDDQEEIEQAVLSVFTELDERARILGTTYPFSLDFHGGVLACTPALEEKPAYWFCLDLSYSAQNESTDTDQGPRLFERLACSAAKGYLGGDAIGFGHPRKELPGRFAEAVDVLCSHLGEGNCFIDRDPEATKDDKLDLAAWKDFPDVRQSKLMMFGQCATGYGWEEKLTELQPEGFWRKWMQEAPVSPFPVRSFFIPHRLPSSGRWVRNAIDAGILFDRFRIAHFASLSGDDLADHLDWLKSRRAAMQAES